LSWRVKGLTLFGAAAISLGSAAAAGFLPVTQAVAAPAITVFVGYADSFHAQGDFPNPWDGSPNVTFDGCAPISACTFDAGAIRVRNDSASSVVVNQVSAHIGSCVYVWKGSTYPVTLAPGSSLITTERSSGAASGCKGPDPATFDSSDIPTTGTCTNDGIQPSVDVTVNGVSTSQVDSGQVLNTGGVDPGSCTGTNESTEWVKIGSKACPGQSLSLAPAAQTHPIDNTATVSATFLNACGSPLSGVLVKFDVIAGPNVGLSGSGVTDASGAARFTYTGMVVGTDTLRASVTNSVGFITNSNTVSVTWIVEFAPGGGSFVIGDNNAVLGGGVNFWSAQWAKQNSLSGGPAPRSFKGFAETPAVPQCGQRWTTDPGNSTPPPDGPLPALMGLIVTSSAQQTGSQIAGNIVEIVIVKTRSGYRPNPGHRGTGTIVGVVCRQSPKATTASQATPSQTAPAALPTQPLVSTGSHCPAGTSDRPARSHGNAPDGGDVCRGRLHS
jgi:hypothetical protein